MENSTDNQEQPQPAQPAQPALLQQLESLGLGAETLAALAADLDPVKTAVLEAPALLELGARCSLARSFIYSRPGATPGAAPLFSFDAKAFESAWLYLCGGDEPAQPPAGS